MRHVLGTALCFACVVGLMLYPTLPGRFDAFALGLSWMAQAASFAGLALVPVGCVWSALEWRWRRAGSAPEEHAGARRGLRVAACAAALPALAATALAGATTVGATLAIAVVLAAAGAAWRTRARSSCASAPPSALPLGLALVPLACVAARLALLPPALDAARERAMDASAPLIAELEACRERSGSYPTTLEALHQDFEPGVIAVERFGYAPSGAAYGLWFEIPSAVFGTREVVLYDPGDRHAFPSHDSDWLRWSEAQRSARPGHYAQLATSRPHWKRFLFD